jgi:hypothetical protein
MKIAIIFNDEASARKTPSDNDSSRACLSTSLTFLGGAHIVKHMKVYTVIVIFPGAEALRKLHVASPLIISVSPLEPMKLTFPPSVF